MMLNTSAGKSGFVLRRRIAMLQKLGLLGSIAGLVAAVACAQTDAGITTAVKSRLAADNTVKAYEIDVDTANGVVTLSGTVDRPVAKQQAVVIARQTDGVTDVVDNIEVSPVPTRTTGDVDDNRDATGDARNAGDRASDAAGRAGAVVTDAAITTAVKAKVLADANTPGTAIDVDTQGGVVTLTGTVASRAAADRAVALARETNGVKNVVNNLKVGK
jgi:osmotically-inducible protein OsmY